jgi:hypothetical protein
VGCCLEGYSGDVASPDFPADGGIADGEYYAYLKDFDPADPTKAVFRVVQIDDCANPDMRNIAECYDIVGPGMRFEIGSESRDIEVALDENLWIVVMSNAENPAVSTDATFRSLFGDGHSLSDLLQVVRADFDELVHPLIESGATLDEVSTALNFDGSPFGYVPFPESNGGYGMVRWYREGYPPLSYSEGSSDQPDILTPKYYDDATSSLYVSDFDRFIRNGGSFELKDGVIAFTYAWEFGGG